MAGQSLLCEEAFRPTLTAPARLAANAVAKSSERSGDLDGTGLPLFRICRNPDRPSHGAGRMRLLAGVGPVGKGLYAGPLVTLGLHFW